MLQQPLMVAAVTTICTWKEEVMVVEVEMEEVEVEEVEVEEVEEEVE
jgi:hypothetical protein